MIGSDALVQYEVAKLEEMEGHQSSDGVVLGCSTYVHVYRNLACFSRGSNFMECKVNGWKVAVAVSISLMLIWFQRLFHGCIVQINTVISERFVGI